MMPLYSVLWPQMYDVAKSWGFQWNTKPSAHAQQHDLGTLC